MQALDIQDQQRARAMKQQGWLPTKALQPVVRACGPSLPAEDSPDAAAMNEKWIQRIGGGALHALDALSGYCVDDAPHDNSPATHEPDVVFVYQSPAGAQLGRCGCFSVGGLARLHAMLHIRTLCFVHVYSGYRRPGDLQWHIEDHHVQGAMQVFCISVDYCLQADKGDLAGEHSTKWWAAQILKGAVFGLGGGPPCETWSAARLLPDGPPPLRSFDEPYGLPALPARSWAQVEVGTRLVLFIIEMLYLCARTGGCGFIEHPAFPVWACAKRPIVASVHCGL